MMVIITMRLPILVCPPLVIVDAVLVSSPTSVLWFHSFTSCVYIRCFGLVLGL